MAAVARRTLSMLLGIYSSLGSRPSLFDRRWVCGFGRSGKMGRCRALLARGPVSGPADARRCCLVSSPARTIPRLWAARQGPAAILESLASDGIGPAWNAGGAISRRVARFASTARPRASCGLWPRMHAEAKTDALSHQGGSHRSGKGAVQTASAAVGVVFAI